MPSISICHYLTPIADIRSPSDLCLDGDALRRQRIGRHAYFSRKNDCGASVLSLFVLVISKLTNSQFQRLNVTAFSQSNTMALGPEDQSFNIISRNAIQRNRIVIRLTSTRAVSAIVRNLDLHVSSLRYFIAFGQASFFPRLSIPRQLEAVVKALNTSIVKCSPIS